MTMRYYLDVLPGGRVRACLSYDQADDGPPNPLWSTQAEGSIVPVDGPVSWAGPSDTAVLHMIDGVLTWIETATLQEAIATALARCYVDIDGIVAGAVGNRAQEYKDAEADARAFIESGCIEPAPRSVAIFAEKNPTMQVQTGEWAARQIIARADALTAAKDDMRDQRFKSQFDMRSATTHAQLDTAVREWAAFIATTRAALGL